jgi:hypothetical protein
MSFRSLLNKLNRRDTHLLPSFSTIIFISIISLISLSSFSLISRSLAQDEPPNIIKTEKEACDAGNNLCSFLEAADKSHAYLAFKTVFGDVPTDQISSGNGFWIPGGMIGTSNQIIGQFYTPAVSGVEYLANLKNEFLGIKPAYAQGVGFYGLQPILPIWKNFRDATYILSSLFFVIIGIMIVLRVKISPQATITIQNAIPQLVTTLILVTFSYAIVGLLIDASYLLQGMAVSLIYPQRVGGILNDFLNVVSEIPLIGQFVPSFANFVEPTIGTTFGVLSVPVFATLFLGFVAGFAVGATLGILGGPVAIVTGVGWGSISAIIIFVILGIGIIIWLFKFMMGLFKCYATLIFKIILAPLEIGLGAFPNSKIGFNSWIMDVISNLAVFPISFLFILLSSKIITTIAAGQTIFTVSELIKLATSGGVDGNWPQNTGLWVPSLIDGGVLLPGAVIASGAIGLSTLMLLSKLPEMIPQFIFMIKPSPWGQAIGEGLNTTFAKPAQFGGQSLLEAGGRFSQDARDAGGGKGWQIAGTIADALQTTGKIKGNH